MIKLEKRRQWLLAGVAASATLLGVGLGWLRHSRPEIDAQEIDRFWQAELARPDGEVVALSTLRGRPLVVNFWATWCPPCVEEMPILERFYQENESKSWQVLGIAIDKEDAVERFLEQNKIQYPIALGGILGPDLLRALGNGEGALPFTLVFDSQGEPIFSKLGKLKEDELKSLI